MAARQFAMRFQEGDGAMQSNRNLDNGLSLFPVSIVALGTPEAPVERLMGVQSAISKGVELLAALRLPLPRFTRPAWLRFHPTSQGNL
jgi:hypothetical protein